MFMLPSSRYREGSETVNPVTAMVASSPMWISPKSQEKTWPPSVALIMNPLPVISEAESMMLPSGA